MRQTAAPLYKRLASLLPIGALGPPASRGALPSEGGGQAEARVAAQTSTWRKSTQRGPTASQLLLLAPCGPVSSREGSGGAD